MENSLRKKPRGKEREEFLHYAYRCVSIHRLSVLFIPSSCLLATRDEEWGVEWRNTDENVIDFVADIVYLASMD